MIATTIEQSRHLLELGLDPKSADTEHCYIDEHNRLFRIKDEGNTKVDNITERLFGVVHIPAWSLSALLKVMPKGAELTKMENDAHELYYEVDYMFTGYEDSNPITAAYEMVCWLLEQGLIEKGGKDENPHRHP